MRGKTNTYADPLCYYRYALNVALSFTQLNGKMTVSWIPITLNLLVHVLMHYYYFSTTTSTNVWWEKYLTALQAGQFIIDICTVYFCTYTYFSYQYWPWFPDWGNCAGSESSFVFACALLSSYLLLFLNSYRLISRVKRSRLNTAGSRTAAVSDSKTDSRSYAEAAASAVEDGSTEATRQRKSKKI
jgi:fatty acid elongase 3